MENTVNNIEQPRPVNGESSFLSENDNDLTHRLIEVQNSFHDQQTKLIRSQNDNIKV